MSVNFHPRPNVPLSVIAFDGTFTDLKEPAPRRAPYLYLTGPHGMTLSLPVTTEAQMAALIEEVDRLATYFAAWQESQLRKEEAA